MSYYQITLLVTEEQENAIVDLFATRRWIYMKTGSSSSHTNFYRGHENGAVPFIDIQAQEHFDNRCKSQEKRCESSSDNSHDVMKPDVTANINKRKHEEHRSCIRKSELSSGNISPFCNSGIKNKSEGEEEKDSFTQEPEMEVEPCKKYESLEVLSKSNISMASLFRIVNSISNLDTADQNTNGPQTNDSRYTSDLKEDQAVETDIAIHTGDKFKGHGKAATPFDSTESGTRTLQAQEMFENMSQEQINNPRLDILHAGIKPDDVAYGNTSDGLTINIIDSPIERCCKASESKNNLLGVCSENPWQHQTSKIVKSMHIKKNHDIESRTKTRSYCNNEILSTSKRDGIESSKQQDSKEMESSKQQEPEKTESYKQQESEDKQQQHEETASYKRKTRSEISSYEKICSKEELFKSSKPSVLGAIINDNFCQYIDTKEINLPERIDTTATSEPERKSEVENIAELKTCRKAKITKYVNIYCMFCEHTFKTQKRYYDHLKYDRCSVT